MSKKITFKENDIENLVIDFLKEIGIYCWKNKHKGTYDPIRKCFRSLSKHQINGLGDIEGSMHDGKFLSIEVKSKKGQVSPDQRLHIKNILASNGVSFVTRSVHQTVQQLGSFYPSLMKDWERVAKKYYIIEQSQSGL